MDPKKSLEIDNYEDLNELKLILNTKKSLKKIYSRNFNL